jgi:hypothetical protein
VGHRELVLTNWSDIISAEAVEGGFSAVPISSSSQLLQTMPIS